MKTPMQVRIKRESYTWEEMSLKKLFSLMKQWPKETFEVKLPCKHTKTDVADGEKRCVKCGDLIEITSYRN